jgi:two-component system, LytTR family, response regulator LytT
VKVLVVDDNISFVTDIRMSLEELGVENVRGEYTEGGALTAIIDFEPDLVICDIWINGNNSGLVLSQFMASMNIPFIIMTEHSYDEVYNEIVKFQPIAFLSKPLDLLALKFSFDTLFKEKIMRPLGEDLLYDPHGNYIFIKKKSKYIKVPFVDILYFEGEGNYVTFYCQNDKYVVRSSLRKCLEKLSEDFFLRISRNCVINFHKIRSYDGDDDTVTVDNVQLPIGRSFKSELKNRLPIM